MRPLTLEEAGDLPASQVGGKAKGLATLAALELPVPPAVVLPVEGHREFNRAGSLDGLMDALGQATERLSWPLAVRSSAADEDREERSAAGQYESVMDVRDLDGLRRAAEHCYRAAGSDRARAYRGEAEAAVALVLQEQVQAQRAGVAFSVDPVSGRQDRVLIEAVFGHGEGLVSGVLEPDRYWVAREDRAVCARRAVKAQLSDGVGRLYPVGEERRMERVLRDDEARRVATLVLSAERGFSTGVDVEFCWSADVLWLVQCRPITTTAEAQP